jgi:hypothetical protein
MQQKQRFKNLERFCINQNKILLFIWFLQTQANEVLSFNIHLLSLVQISRSYQ